MSNLFLIDIVYENIKIHYNDPYSYFICCKNKKRIYCESLHELPKCFLREKSDWIWFFNDYFLFVNQIYVHKIMQFLIWIIEI